MSSLSGHQHWIVSSMMLLVLVCWLLALAVRADGLTDHVYIDGVAHRTELLYKFTLLDPWYCSLALDYKHNYLYYRDDSIFKLNLNTKEHNSYVSGLNKVFSVTVDQETHDLYIGSWNGLYKKSGLDEDYIYHNPFVQPYQVYFHGVLYYTDFKSKRLFALINGDSDELVYMQYEVSRLVIDNEDVMFFSNVTGLYGRQMDSAHVTSYYNKSSVYDLAMNRNGKVYFTSDEGIYETIKYNTSYREIVSVQGAKAIAFDKDNNMVYCNNKGIYRLISIARVNVTNNRSDIHEPNIDVTNNTNTINKEKQLEIKLDIMDTKIDKLVTDHEEMLKSMDRKIKDLSQKLEADQDKILKSVTKMYKLITDIGEKHQELERMNVTEEPVPGQVYEQVHYSASSPRADNSSTLVASP